MIDEAPRPLRSGPGWRTTKATGTSPHFSSGRADDSHFENRRVLVKDPLDLRSGDVLAAGDDHVLQPIDDVQVAVFVSRPMSPVWNQPPAKASLVASASRQYPAKTFGPRRTISPRVARRHRFGLCRPRCRPPRKGTDGRRFLASSARSARSKKVSPETVSVRP